MARPGVTSPGRFQEANLIIVELDQMNAKQKLPIDILLEKWLLHSEVAVGLKHYKDAVHAVEMAELQVGPKNGTPLN